MYLVNGSAQGALKVTLHDKIGRIVREWSSPENPNNYFISWHVFDIDGATGAVTSFDKTSDNGLPIGPHYPTEPVCTTPMEM